MSSRIAAKFPSKEEFFNEDLFKSQLKSAIDASLADITKRSASLSPSSQLTNHGPRGTRSPPIMNGYNHVASAQPRRSRTPNDKHTWKVVQSNVR